MTNEKIVKKIYEQYYEKLFRFISLRINNTEDACDLAQDVFLRVLEHAAVIYEETAESLLFAIARNIVNDFLRRHYCKKEIDRYLMDYTPVSNNTTESRLYATELASLERKRLALMPKQRRTIYIMRRFGEKSAKEISEELNISHRTVENHLYIGVNQMREYLRACI